MQAILGKLHIQSNGGIIGYVLYFLIFLYIVVLMFQKKSNLFITILMTIAIMCALIDKIDAIPRASFGVFIVRILMFTIPLVVAGMTKWEKARGPGILAGFIAVVYLFARWFGEQKPQ
jgi:hypothetical protein